MKQLVLILMLGLIGCGDSTPPIGPNPDGGISPDGLSSGDGSSAGLKLSGQFTSGSTISKGSNYVLQSQIGHPVETTTMTVDKYELRYNAIVIP